jgi:hypothetical protein
MNEIVAEFDRLRSSRGCTWDWVAAAAGLPSSVLASIRETLAGREPCFFALTREDISGISRVLDLDPADVLLQFVATDTDELAARAELRAVVRALARHTVAPE